MNYSLEIHENFDESIEKIWDEFEKNSVNYCFQNFYWLKNWYLNLENSENIKIVNILVSKKDELKIILPLCVKEYRGIKYLKWQGGDRADYMSGLFTNNFEIKKREFFNLWQLIKNKIGLFDIVYLERQPKFIENIPNPFVEFLNVEKDYFSSSIILEKSYDEFSNKNLKKKFTDDTKRRVNSLKKKGNLSFKIYEFQNEEEKRQVTTKILDQKIQRIKKLSLKDNFNKEAKDFYINFENRKFKNGQLHISSLNLNEEPISFHWGVKYKHRFYHLMPSTPDTEYMRFSPGRILLQYLIKWSIDTNLKELDFTIGDEPYKKDWYNNKNMLYSCIEKNNFKYFLNYLLIKIKVKSINFMKKFNFIKKGYRQLTRILR